MPRASFKQRLVARTVVLLASDELTPDHRDELEHALRELRRRGSGRLPSYWQGYAHRIGVKP